MPLLGEALRDSKLFSLPPKSVARRIKSDNVPRHQALVAPSASAARKDWGLKFPVTEARKKIISFDQFEDNLHTNGIDAYPRFPRKIKNIEYLGEPVQLPRDGRLNSLYSAPKTEPRKGLQHLSASEFRKIVQAAKETPAGSMSSSDLLRKYNVVDPRSVLPSEGVPIQWQNSGIGLSYAGPRVLRNTPEGVYSHRTVKARVLPANNRVAVGGFLAANYRGHAAFGQIPGSTPYKATRDVIPASVSATSNSGDVQINVLPAEKPADLVGGLS